MPPHPRPPPHRLHRPLLTWTPEGPAENVVTAVVAQAARGTCREYHLARRFGCLRRSPSSSQTQSRKFVCVRVATTARRPIRGGRRVQCWQTLTDPQKPRSIDRSPHYLSSAARTAICIFFGGSRPARGDKDHTIGGGEEGVASRRCEGVHGGGAGSGGNTSGAEGRVWRAVTGRGPTWGERWCRGARVRAAEGAARFSPASSFGSLFVRSDCLSERLRESLFGRMSVGPNGRCSTGRRLVRHV